MHADPAKTPRVLVVKLSSLGDLFHALPAVHNIKVGLKAEIDWVVQKEYTGIVECFTDVSKVIPFYRRSFFKHFGDFRKQLRAEEYDYVIDFQGLLKSAIVTRLARGAKRIGPSFHREGASLFYKETSGDKNKNRHAVEENLDIVRHLNLELLPPKFNIEFPLIHLEHQRPLICMLPESRWKTKNWPVEYFIETGLKLVEETGGTLILMGSPDDRAACEEIQNRIPGSVNMAGETNLVEMGSVLSRADLLISNDSGPMHIGAAVGIPALAIFGPTDPRRTGPYGPRCRVVKNEVPCQPCFSRNCAVGDHGCMTGLQPREVTSMALRMLGFENV